MKRFVLTLLTLGTATAFAQTGTNGYVEGVPGSQEAMNYTSASAYDGVYEANGDYGYNAAAPAGGTVTTYTTQNYATGTVVTGGVVHHPMRDRVRWEWSPCGQFKWRIVEHAYFVPGHYVYDHGCRRWVNGYYDWRPAGRTKVWVRGNGHGHGHGHGHHKGPRR